MIPVGIAGDADPLRAYLDAGLEDLDPELDGAARDTLIAYINLLDRWNRAYNLTAVRDRRDMIQRHLLDSLTVLPHLRGERFLDVGSGAGLPGLVLAVARPDLAWVLLDSNAKKHRFLIRACLELGLENAQPVRARVEEFHPGNRFSTIISRAFASAAELLTAAGRLLEPGGRLLAMKGRYPERELAALDGMASRVEVVPLRVPGLEHEQRHLVVVTAP